MLLLDEPLGALDLKLRREMQLELKQIQRDVGITFVFVTHDQEEALTMSDRVAVFNDGRVEQVATPVELYEHPASSFVAGFVGTSNLIGGEAARQRARHRRRVRRPAREAADRRGRRPGSSPTRCPPRDASARSSTSDPAPTAIVELDAGPRLTVSRPEQRSDPPMPPLEASDRPIAVVFDRGSLISLSGPHRETQEKS